MPPRSSRLIAACLLLAGAPAWAADNELTAQEKQDGYVLLFNGKDLTGWHRPGKGLGGWHVEDGAITLGGKSGMLYADGKYDNFVLHIDFKMSRGCNSGVFLRVGDPRDEVQTGFEIQVLDSHGKKLSRHSCGAIYDLVPPSKDAAKPAGEWNTFVITADRSRLAVVLNGEAVAEMDVDRWDTPGKQPDGTKNKFKKAVKDFPRSGLIGLQDHNHPVWYKNIKLKPLR